MQGTAVERHALVRSFTRRTAGAVAVLAVAALAVAGVSLATSVPSGSDPYVLTSSEQQSHVDRQSGYVAGAEAAARAEIARKEAAVEAARKAAAERAARSAARAVADPRSAARALLGEYGWGEDQFGCLASLWTRESDWDHRAQNPSSGAYGIPQSLPAGKMASAGTDWRSNPGTQIRWGLGYIRDVYGSPCGAWGHSQSVGWY
ncbi:MAG: lytic transglycosylase domain-containing protein [Jiangellaceae bacterium]